MAQTKVLFISQEITPYVPQTPSSVLGKELATCIAEKGYEVRTFMPKYSAINERRNQLHEVIRLSRLNIIIDDNDHPLVIKVATLLPVRMQVYFIDSDDYFNESGSTTLDTYLHPENNDERMMFYVRGVIETVKKLRWEPAVIQCDGWISALAPLYLKKLYSDDPSFRRSKIVYTLRNDIFDGTLDERFLEKLHQEKVKDTWVKSLGKKAVTHATLTKLAIDHADAIVQAEDGIDPEILEYAKASGKPMLEFTTAEERPARMLSFYESLLADSAK